LAELLGIFPSRLVLLLDDLDKNGSVERHASPTDRRSHALRLTAAGRTLLKEIGRIARQHQNDLFGALTHAERAQLGELLARIADEQNLRARVHPGYRKP